MSRLETGTLKLCLDWYDINELINSVVQKLSSTHLQRIVFESIDSLPLFKFDQGIMENVIQNLLHNAINYTLPDSVIKIDIEHLNEQCVISISDNGPGIPEDEIDQIFEKFFRVQQSKTSGIGLGLSIVKGFVEAHRGSISAKNNLSGGVTFKIEIPAEVSYINYLQNE